MILHVAGPSPFIPRYIRFIEEHFGLHGHFFWLKDNGKQYTTEKKENVYIAESGVIGKSIAFFYLAFLLQKADKVILHGLFDARIIIMLSLMPWVSKKCYWVLWGGDYFCYKYSEKTITFRLIELFRHMLIPRIGNLITYIPGSVNSVRAWYGAKGQYHECLAYPSNTFKIKPNLTSRKNDGTVRVLIGNSATATNQHEQIFRIIAPYVHEGVLLYVPLSYGDKEYAQKVIEMGQKLFGNQFIPLTQFLPHAEYQQLMVDIDIVLFNHNRQQAMGNTINLLGMDKKLYMRSDISSWEFLVSKGIRLYDIERFEGFEVSNRTTENLYSISQYFAEAKLVQQWAKIFNG